MPVYWSMLVMALVVGLLGSYTPRRKVELEGNVLRRIHPVWVLIAVSYVVFFIGMRDVVLDSYAYIATYNAIPDTWGKMLTSVARSSTGKGYQLLSGIFKLLISHSHYLWHLTVAAVSCFCAFKVLYKYSIDFSMTFFLYIATTTFTWLLNGTRQYLAVCIMFSCTDWLLQGKKWKYCMAALLATAIHSSAIFVIPVSFFVTSGKVLDKRMKWFAVIAAVGIYFSDSVFHILGSFMDKDYSASIAAGKGSNVLRLAVQLVPVMIVFLTKPLVEKRATPSICLAINMSFVGACFYVASTFTSGILIGRMPIYFTMYNLYLLPWLLKKCFTKDSYKIISIICAVLYVLYFYYQMMVAWHGLPYVSYALGLNYR